ncbi:MAG: response regulator [Calditrichaeota bacterium]|nr:MAG: response regulator [Calditrichota bacterium]
MTFHTNRSEKQILETILAISHSAEILANTDTPKKAIPKVLEELGKATAVSRVYLYKVISQTNDDLVVRQIYEWITDNSSIPIKSVPSRNVQMAKNGYGRWVDAFLKRDAVFGLVKDFPKSEIQMLDVQQIQSICVFPLQVNGKMYGFIGFDDCESQRIWNQIEIETLKTAANILGSFLQVKQTEVALRISEDIFKNIFLNSTMGLYRTSPDGQVLMANPALLEKLGYENLEELQQIDLNDHETNHCYNRQEFINKISESGIIRGYETTWTKKDGSLIHIRESARIVKDKHDNIMYFEGSIEDITEQKYAEDALIENRKLLKEAQKIGNVGNWEFDIASGEIKWSEQVYHIFNRNKNDGPPSSIDEVYAYFSVESRIRMKENLQEALKDGKKKSSEYQLKPYNDEVKTLYGVIFPILSEDKVVKLRGIIQDITALKKTEEQMIKTQKLESVGLLAGGIAHDFNNLLTGILGNIALAKLELDSNDSAYSILDDAESATVMAKDLTSQLLTFSSGGQPLLKPTDIKDILTSATNMVIKNSNTHPEFNLNSDLAKVKVDPAQIRQVFYNLTLNSEQAMPNGGKLRVSAENIKISDQVDIPIRTGSYVCIKIQDEGVGIPQKNLPKIFDPYYTTKQTGSGLGLATAYSIVKKHHGYLFINSVLGEGTTAELYLPEFKEPIEAVASEEPKKIENKKALGKILVMDDEDFIRSLASRVLSKAGFEVVTVTDGESALLSYKQAYNSTSRFDIVILDLVVPEGLGGKETIDQLRHIDPYVKAIVCSGYSNDPIMSFYTQYGFSAVLSKPYKPEELVDIVKFLLKQSTKL